MLAGAAAGAALSVVLAAVTVGPAGVAAFAHVVLTPTYSPVLRLQNAEAFVASWLGESNPSFALGMLLSLVAFAAAAFIGNASRMRENALEPALFAATALSLFGAPHLLGHDLTLLVPTFVAMLAWQWREEAPLWPGRGTFALLACWTMLGLAARQDLGESFVGPPGRLTPLALLLLAAAGVAALRLRPLYEAHAAA